LGVYRETPPAQHAVIFACIRAEAETAMTEEVRYMATGKWFGRLAMGLAAGAAGTAAMDAYWVA
jgi:hypothetical protein